MTERPGLLVSGLTALVVGALVVYSQTKAFAWDEGWHLLAAQSIGRGMRPYLDFCYPQTPLNAYWNAGWFRVFGDTWRTAHAVSAVMTSLAILLTAQYLMRHFPVSKWRPVAAIAGTVLFGLNAMVFEFGTIGQAYGLCLFLIVAAFRAAVAAVGRGWPFLAAAAGFLACAAANASLLTAPVAPILLIWIFLYNRAGSRWGKAAAFVAGGAIPFLPLAVLFAQGPRQTIFNVLEYNFSYRQVHWEGAIEHDIGVMLAWIDSSQALLLVLLVVTGAIFIWKHSQWERHQRAEFSLCGWLAAGECAHIATAHPHFERYYMFAVPFLAILACAGLYAACARIAAPDRPFWPVTIVALLVSLGLAKSLFETRGYFVWSEVEDIARKVNEVTPPRGTLLADEPTYFVSRRKPPEGMELADSHKLDLAPGVMAQMHLVSGKELDRRVKSGGFDTIVTSEEDDRIASLGLRKMYGRHVEIAETHIFWGRVGAAR